MSDLEAAFQKLATWAEGSSPLYARLCRRIPDEPALLDLAGQAPPERARPHLLLASVQYLLFDSPDDPLAAYYPSVVADPREPDEELLDAFRTFCLAHEDDIEGLLTTRRNQTNSVRRSAALYPGFARVAEAVDGPIAFVELGPSAGLNLLFDRYRYDYDGRVVGPPDSPVTISSAIRGDLDPPLPDRPPAVHSRVGIDLNPLDVTDPADAGWLQALVWPEHEDRRRVLEGALAVAREDPPRLVEGDLLADLPAVVADVPVNVPVCVFDTLVLYQVPVEVRERLRETIRDLAASRPLHWLAGEEEYGEGGEAFELTWTGEGDGAVDAETLAAFQPHGAWVEWLADDG